LILFSQYAKRISLAIIKVLQMSFCSSTLSSERDLPREAGSFHFIKDSLSIGHIYQVFLIEFYDNIT
ncbi:hypothetical protein, partial [Bacillus anthracis]|uniref:hypothetical protein n=1 Tax=Bacillus anthracis TaxID=1392 RepID=UPI001E55CA46